MAPLCPFAFPFHQSSLSHFVFIILQPHFFSTLLSYTLIVLVLVIYCLITSSSSLELTIPTSSCVRFTINSIILACEERYVAHISGVQWVPEARPGIADSRRVAGDKNTPGRCLQAGTRQRRLITSRIRQIHELFSRLAVKSQRPVTTPVGVRCAVG